MLVSSTTGYEADGFRAAAHQLGATCVLATNRCPRLDDPWGDDALAIRFEDAEDAAKAIVEQARREPVDAIVAIGDATTRIAALAARALGLPHNAPEAAEAARNKFEARARFAAAGVRVPFFKRLPVDGAPAELARDVPYPCVLKPLALSASRGVIRADGPRAFVAAFQRIAAILQEADVRALGKDAARWILVEAFIPGREVALEGLLEDGRLKTLAIFDKPDPLDGPFFEETLYVTPSRLPPEVQDAIRTCAEQAALALGLRHGPIHAELRVNELGPWILEVAPRSIGGLCGRALKFGVGISLEELILRHALGHDVSALTREGQASGVMMLPVPHGGWFKEVRGVLAATRVPGVVDVVITAKPDYKLRAWPEGSTYVGFLFARGADPAEVESALREGHRALEIVITPDLPVAR